VDDREALTQLRSLLARGDDVGLVAALSSAPWPADSLQLIGDGLVAALRSGADGSVATRSGRSAKRTMTTRTDDCGSTPKDHVPATATRSGSSRTSKTRTSPIGSPEQSLGAAPSDGSKTGCRSVLS